VRLLLDTHALLWFYHILVIRSLVPRLAWRSRPSQDQADQSDFIQHAIVDNGFLILPVTPGHTSALTALPYHHKDPFDRLLVAQAIVESLPLVSGDPLLDKYPITHLW